MSKTHAIQPDAVIIGKRVEKFILARYGGISAASKTLGKHPVQIRQYIRGISKPGFEILSLLARDGADCTWLLTGSPFHPDEKIKTQLRIIQDIADALEKPGAPDKPEIE